MVGSGHSVIKFYLSTELYGISEQLNLLPKRDCDADKYYPKEG